MDKILLIEDDEALALGIEFTLKNEGFQVKRSSKIKEAEVLFNNEEFNLILLDVMLPDGNGYDLCKNIRVKSSIPIIFLTACDDEVNIVQGLDLGADDYITKPFRVRELISRIKAILRRISNSISKEENILKSGKIKIDTLKAEVYINDNVILLTAQEYKILLLFMSNSEKLMDREEILNSIQEGSGAYFDPNTLAVYIKRIREKIEEDSSNPKYIITQRGMGYKWNTPVTKE